MNAGPYEKTTFKPKLSIVMPNWNKGEELQEAIDSWINQSFEDWELILVDDGSDQELDHYILSKIKDPRIIVHKLRVNEGQCRARHIGEEMARSNIILRADADDLALPERARISYEEMTSHPIPSFFYGGYWEQTEKKTQYIHALPFDFQRLLNTGLFYIGVCTIAFDKRLHRHPRSNPLGRRSDDWMFQYEAIRSHARMKWLDVPLTIYRAPQERVDRYAPGENRERLYQKKLPYLKELQNAM